MIEDGFSYLALLTMISSIVVYSEREYKWRLFEYLPAIVIIYFAVMLFSTMGLWSKTPDITATYKTIKSDILPAMIFLLLLQADLREIAKIGKKMLFAFFLASASISFGFIGMFAILHSYFEPDAWRAFSALSGSWMGGTANMVAIQGALGIADTDMGYALLIDSIDYAIWVMILLALVPLAKRFDHWSGADGTALREVGERLTLSQTKDSISFQSIFLLLGTALSVSAMSRYLATDLPTNSFITQTTWVVIVATISGIIAAMTPLSQKAGSNELGNISLYIIVALIASRADFYELTQAPLYIVAGFIIIAIHILLMVISARIFKLDLFTLGVASLANIGGVASAPILAGAYSKALIPVGVLMAMMGYIVGTFGGLAVGKVLEMISAL